MADQPVQEEKQAEESTSQPAQQEEAVESTPSPSEVTAAPTPPPVASVPALPIAVYNEKTLGMLHPSSPAEQSRTSEYTPLLIPTTRDDDHHTSMTSDGEDDDTFEFAIGNVARRHELPSFLRWIPFLNQTESEPVVETHPDFDTSDDSNNQSAYAVTKKVCTSTVVWLNRVAGVAVVSSLILLSLMALLYFVTDEVSGASGDVGASGTHGKTTEEAQRRSHSNMIVTILDDSGYSDLGSGSTVSDYTPTFSKVFSEGMSFSSYYTMPSCTPSRAAILTGVYPFRMGLQANEVDPTTPWGSSSSVAMLPEYLKAVGYDTHLVGKWHLGHANESMLPTSRGFDSFNGFVTDSVDPYSLVSMSSCETVTDSESETCYMDTTFDDVDPSVNVVDRLTNVAEDIISRYAKDSEVKPSKQGSTSTPFFMMLSFPKMAATMTEPTSVYSTYPELNEIEDEDRRVFTASLALMDSSFNRVVEATRKNNLFDDTMFIVLSDNGASSSEGGSNFPFRGSKMSVLEGAVRVGCAMYAPVLLPPVSSGTEYSGLFHAVDWLPTLVNGYLNVDTDDERIAALSSSATMDGVNHWDYIASEMDLASVMEGLSDASVDELVKSSSLYAKAPELAMLMKDDITEASKMYGARAEMIINLNIFSKTGESVSLQEVGGPDDYILYGAVRMGSWKLILNENLNSEGSSAEEIGALVASIQDGSISEEEAGLSTMLVNLKLDPSESQDWSDMFPTKVNELTGLLKSTYLSAVEKALPSTRDTSAYPVWQKHESTIVPWLE